MTFKLVILNSLEECYIHYTCSTKLTKEEMVASYITLQNLTCHIITVNVSYPTLSMYNEYVQTYGRLKELLDRDNIEYDERKFETEDGIAGLGERTFVSSQLIIVYSNSGRINNCIQDPNSRIHVIATYSPHARHLLCKVSCNKMM